MNCRKNRTKKMLNRRTLKFWKDYRICPLDRDNFSNKSFLKSTKSQLLSYFYLFFQYMLLGRKTLISSRQWTVTCRYTIDSAYINNRLKESNIFIHYLIDSTTKTYFHFATWLIFFLLFEINSKNIIHLSIW